MIKFDGLTEFINNIKEKFLENNVVNMREMMYSQFTEAKKKWKDLNEGTYRRYVRKVTHKNTKTMPPQQTYLSSDGTIMNPQYSDKKTRVLVISDLHCGHITGLTPPAWWQTLDNEIFREAALMQRQGWKFFSETVKFIEKDHKIDLVLLNGDAIDGNQKITAGSEAITTDRLNQVQMAKECLDIINCKQFVIVPGSPYHVGKTEDWEKVLAEQIGADFEEDLKMEVNGKIINARHKIGGTSVEYGKATQILKHALVEDLRALSEKSDVIADIVIRSHVHYFVEVKKKDKVCVVTPSLQLKSKFGNRQCLTIIDYGVYVIDIYDDGRIETQPYIANLHLRDNDLLVFEKKED